MRNDAFKQLYKIVNKTHSLQIFLYFVLFINIIELNILSCLKLCNSLSLSCMGIRIFIANKNDENRSVLFTSKCCRLYELYRYLNYLLILGYKTCICYTSNNVVKATIQKNFQLKIFPFRILTINFAQIFYWLNN